MPPASPVPLTSPLLMGDASQCHNRWPTNSRISWNRGFLLGQEWHIVSRSWPGPSQRMFAARRTPSSPPSARRHKTTPSLTRSGKKYFELNPRWKQHSIDKKFYIRIFPFFYASQYFLANSFFSLFSTFPIWLDAQRLRRLDRFDWLSSWVRLQVFFMTDIWYNQIIIIIRSQ